MFPTAFYPPLYDLATAVSFQVFGTSLFSARLVSAVFSVLSLGAVFELAYTMYNGKTALLTTILLGIMPGYFWLSRQALLEIMLLFFVMVGAFVFFPLAPKQAGQIFSFGWFSGGFRVFN